MFSLEGKLYQGLAVLWHLIYVNVLVMIFSLPIITIGAALTAGINVIEPSGGNIFYRFFESFKKNWLVSLPILVINFISVYFYFMFDMTMLETPLKMLYYVFIIFLLNFNVNCYVILSKVQNIKIFDMFRYGFMLTVISIAKTIWIPVVWVLLVLYAYPYLGLILNLMLVSLPLYVHIKMNLKEVKIIKDYLSNIGKEG